MGEYRGKAKDEYRKIERSLRENRIHGHFVDGSKKIQGSQLSVLSIYPEVELQDGGVHYSDLSEHGLKYRLSIYEKEFKNK